MAKLRGSSRPTSRQSQDAVQPTGRITRARSGTPQTSRSNVASTATASSSHQRIRSKQKPQHDLTAVEEDSASLDGNDDAGEDNDIKVFSPGSEPASTREFDLAGHASVQSGISGFTTKTSFSQEERDYLESGVMIEGLEDLMNAAHVVERFLLPAGSDQRKLVLKEIHTTNSLMKNRFSVKSRLFDHAKGNFGRTEYLRPDIILRVLARAAQMGDIPDESWRPDSLIYMVNLVQMLRALLDKAYDASSIDGEGFDALETLDASFPAYVVGAEFNHNAFKLHLHLLVQLCIIRLKIFKSHEDYDPLLIIDGTFYGEDGTPDHQFKHTNALHISTLPLEQQDECHAEVAEVVQTFKETVETHPIDTAAAAATMAALFPWTEFLEEAVDYYFERKQELEQQIRSVGGVEQLISNARQEVTRRTAMHEAEEKRRRLSQPGSKPKKPLAGLKTLKMLEKKVVQSTAPVVNTEPVEIVRPAASLPLPPPDDTDLVTPDDDNVVRDPSPDPPTAPISSRASLAVLQGFQQQQRQIAAKQKGKFIDRQAGAHRVSFDDNIPSQRIAAPSDRSTDSQRPQSTVSISSSSQNNVSRKPTKRTRDDMDEDFDPTQDTGFQVDRRDLAEADERRRTAPQQIQPAFRPSPFAAEYRQSSGVSARGSVSHERQNPGSAMPAPLEPLAPDDDTELPDSERYQRIKIMNRLDNLVMKKRKPQKRIPWSPAEEQALIDYIAEYGEDSVPYAPIKRVDELRPGGPALSNRSAEDLRFKARDMKEGFLKQHQELPRNFESILLPAAAIARLRGRGIEYEQERVRG